MSDYNKLKSLLQEMGGVVIGYSGGVDSTLLAKAATDALGENAVCVLIESQLVPGSEVRLAVAVAREHGFSLIRIKADVLTVDGVPENPPDRCYHCKKAVFSIMADIARERGLKYVLDGANVDDESDYRPGTRATSELGVRSPLKELGFTKAKIREISREVALPTWDRPSYACLASRIPYGTPLTEETLAKVEKAEQSLREMGFRQFRVRHHGDVARIEFTADEMEKALSSDMREKISREVKSAGYSYVTMDLTGYRVGSMNEVLNI